MKLEIKSVDDSNRLEVLTLQVLPEQRGFIETPEECLKEAEEWPEFRPVGLYSDGMLVGFAMYGALLDNVGGRNVWLDRLLIDAQHQRRGYGRRFTELLIARLEVEYGKQPIYLSVYEENASARKLYESLGFQFINEYDADGELIYRKK
ncbi:GNAT family N-acetyltransferase [Sporosarcina jeotgali]|uniref:GNAT family N-acetyltransferase n=1 Tax=Sporosarcina jeotgali TaxID=3020056 RepID=A0ABZ0KYH6_9BACL|nr:GNAT family N-acetyltransferase [Sporosarcina sp. B2O-1]WOV85025.1 GNAT family N-acetyltransferase [Sporosarcina sp. B2O-1]